MTVTKAELVEAASYPVKTRHARITRVRPEVRDEQVVRYLGQIQIFSDASRVEIVVGIGATADEWDACDAHRVLLPGYLPIDAPELWNDDTNRRSGERMFTTCLPLPVPDPVIELELQMLLDTTSEVTA